jgi:SAM-dependent methyltransferase
VTGFQPELDRARRAFARRDTDPAVARRYDPIGAVNRFRLQELDWITAEMLAQSGLASLGGIDILEVGCGSGGMLQRLVGLGADPAQLAGVDLVEDRIEIGPSQVSNGRVSGRECPRASLRRRGVRPRQPDDTLLVRGRSEAPIGDCGGDAPGHAPGRSDSLVRRPPGDTGPGVRADPGGRSGAIVSRMPDREPVRDAPMVADRAGRSLKPAGLPAPRAGSVALLAHRRGDPSILRLVF